MERCSRFLLLAVCCLGLLAVSERGVTGQSNATVPDNQASSSNTITEATFTEDTTTEETSTEDSTTEETSTEDTTTEEAYTEDTTTEEAYTEDTTTEEAYTEDTTTEEAYTEDTTTEEAYTEDTTTEETSTEDTTTEETSTEESPVETPPSVEESVFDGILTEGTPTDDDASASDPYSDSTSSFDLVFGPTAANDTDSVFDNMTVVNTTPGSSVDGTTGDTWNAIDINDTYPTDFYDEYDDDVYWDLPSDNDTVTASSPDDVTEESFDDVIPGDNVTVAEEADAANEGNVSSSDTESSTETKPIYDDESIYDDDKPIYDDDESIYDDQQPIYDDDESIYDDQQPIYDDDESIYDDHKPIYDEDYDYNEYGGDYEESSERSNMTSSNDTDISATDDDSSTVATDESDATTPSNDTSVDDVTSSNDTVGIESAPSNETTDESTPQAPVKADFVVNDSNSRPCLLASLNITIHFKYHVQEGLVRETYETVSKKNTQDGSRYQGTCENSLSTLSITWNNDTFTLNLTFTLKSRTEGTPNEIDMDVLPAGANTSTDTWTLQQVSLSYDTGNEQMFPGAYNPTVETVMAEELNLFRTPLGMAYMCKTPEVVVVEFKDVDLAFNYMHLMPFGAISQYFSNDTVECSGDMSSVPSKDESYTVPLVVAGVLAGIVASILIAYAAVRCVARRMRQADYKQME